MNFCSLHIFTLILALAAFTVPLQAQAADKPSVGIELFNKGDYAGAVQTLKGSKNYVELSYLGLAYEKLGKTKEAGKALDDSFERTFWLITNVLAQKPKIFGKHQDAPKGTAGERLNALKEPIAFAVATAAKATALKSGDSKNDLFKKRVELLAGLRSVLERGETIYAEADVTTKLNFTHKPIPRYTDEARRNLIQGTVFLLALFKQDGTLIYVPLNTIQGGLMPGIYDAANAIKFTPAMMDGKPVTVLDTLEHRFEIF